MLSNKPSEQVKNLAVIMAGLPLRMVRRALRFIRMGRWRRDMWVLLIEIVISVLFGLKAKIKTLQINEREYKSEE